MTWVDAGVLVTLQASTWFVVWVLAFGGIGRFCLADSAHLFETRAGRWLGAVLAISAGMFLVSLWVFILSWLGMVNGYWLALPLAAGLLKTGAVFNRSIKMRLAEEAAAFRGSSSADRAIACFLALITVSSFLAAQSPEVGNDALAYHLYFPRLIAEAGRWIPPEHPRSLWPSMMGMLYLVGFIFQGVALAKLFSWLAAPLAVIGVVAASAYFGGEKRTVRLAAVLMGMVPAIWMQSLYAYSDNAIMLYFFLAAVTAVLWGRFPQWRGGGLLVAIFLAALASLKYSALILIVVLAPVLFLGVSWSALGAMVLGAGLSCGWYLRSWVLTGNPVFPFAKGIFGTGFSQRMVGFSILPKNAATFLSTPWNLSIHPPIYGGEPLGCLFLLVLPLIFFMPRPDRVRAVWNYCTLAVAVTWYLTIQHARFFLPVLPFLALLLSEAFSRWLEERELIFKRLCLGVCLLMAFLQWSLCEYYVLRMLQPAIGLQGGRDYLRRNERTFAFVESITPLVSGEKTLFLSEPRLFYAPKGSVYLNPMISERLDREGRSLEKYLKEESIRFIVTSAMEAEAPNPPVPAQLVLRGQSLGGEKFSYALWKRAGA